MPGPKVMIVEDEGIEALDIQYKLKSLGYRTTDIVFREKRPSKEPASYAPTSC